MNHSSRTAPRCASRDDAAIQWHTRDRLPLDVTKIVTAIQPDVLVNGADWVPGQIVGSDIVEARRGWVVRIPLAEGYSTTQLIERIKGSRAAAPVRSS